MKTSDRIVRAHRDAQFMKATGERVVYKTTVTGFYLSVEPTGRKMWVVRYSIGRGREGRKERWWAFQEVDTSESLATLPGGRPNPGKFGAAADEARRVRNEARLKGIDPQGEREASKQTPEFTFEALFRAWVDKHGKPNKKSWRNDVHLFTRHMKTPEGERPLHLGQRLAATDYRKVTRKDLTQARDAVAGAVSHIQANRCISIWTAVFNFAVDEGLVANSPAVRLRKAGKEAKRDRQMTDRELKLLWTADLPRPQLLVIRLLALLGAREDEVCSIEARELGGDTWTIPAGRMKAGKAHEWPLPPLALAYARELATIGAPHRQTISHVPSEVRGAPGSTAHADYCDCNLMRPTVMTEADKLRPHHAWCWKVHTLRHTAKTRWGKMRWSMTDPETGKEVVQLGVPEGLSDKITAHASKRGAGSIYDHGDWIEARRAVLTAWETMLLTIVGERSSVRPAIPLTDEFGFWHG